jgi:transcriptional regulator with XRE-family HTH domain
MATAFSNRITALRKERGLSQKEVAMSLGVSQALLSHYEKGVRECGLEFVVRCAEYFGVTTDYLLGKDDSKYGTYNALLGEYGKTLYEDENCKFVLRIGSKRLIKRQMFEKYLEQAYSL